MNCTIPSHLEPSDVLEHLKSLKRAARLLTPYEFVYLLGRLCGVDEGECAPTRRCERSDVRLSDAIQAIRVA